MLRLFLRNTTNCKSRQPGQGGDADPQVPDLRAQLLEAEAAHFSKTNPAAAKSADSSIASKRRIEEGPVLSGEKENLEAKRRRILEETRDVDADSDSSKGDDSGEEDRYALGNPDLGDLLIQGSRQ